MPNTRHAHANVGPSPTRRNLTDRLSIALSVAATNQPSICTPPPLLRNCNSAYSQPCTASCRCQHSSHMLRRSLFPCLQHHLSCAALVAGPRLAKLSTFAMSPQRLPPSRLLLPPLFRISGIIRRSHYPTTCFGHRSLGHCSKSQSNRTQFESNMIRPVHNSHQTIEWLVTIGLGTTTLFTRPRIETNSVCLTSVDYSAL